ncbi:MAG: hypothetical protein V1773_14455 [bacterium]
MEQTKITCNDAINHLCQNLGEELNSPKCIAIKEHVHNCKTCKSYLNSINTTIEFYKNYNEEITEEMHNKLMEYLNINECKE